jgi:tetratricopeptide (TPR) repeat protein
MSLDKAKALAANGRIAEAETLFDALVRAKPKNAVVLSTYVRFHNRYSRKFRKAAAAVESLVALKPKSAEVQALAAETYSNCKRLAEAEQHAAAALHIDPANPDSLFIAAHVDAARNRPDAAIAKIEVALTKRPDHMPSLIQKGRYLRAAGDLAKAAAVARDLWETHPDISTSLACYSQSAQWPLTTPFSHISSCRSCRHSRKQAASLLRTRSSFWQRPI